MHAPGNNCFPLKSAATTWGLDRLPKLGQRAQEKAYYEGGQEI